MAAESALWRLLRASVLPGHWVRVENRVQRGTPDVNYCVSGVEGWLELKSVDNWPIRGGVLLIKHFTIQQRLWLRERCLAGGRAALLLRIEKPKKQYLLFDGLYAAGSLGMVSRKSLETNALIMWGPKMNRDAFLAGLLRGGS